jgi:hypothetical protein
LKVEWISYGFFLLLLMLLLLGCDAGRAARQ